MRFRLGYVDGPISLPFTYCHTMTYTGFKKLDKEEAYQKLYEIINMNLDNFLKVLKFNAKNNITFYRMSHTIVPLATLEEVSFDYVSPFEKKWKEIGDFINKNKMRVDSHPNQYCVLNSTNEEIVKNSIDIIRFNYNLFQAMEIKGMIILHVGSGKDNKSEALKRFKDNFCKLNKSLQEIITIENDDKIFTAEDVLCLCEELGIPMTLDYHHFLCNHNNEKLKDLLPRIIATWKRTGFNPKVHFSSPKSKKDFRSHSDFINYNAFLRFIYILKPFNQDFDIMLECKAKEDALFSLSRGLSYTEGIKRINYSTFETK